MNRTPKSVPLAAVVSFTETTATILCPYCGGEQTHDLGGHPTARPRLHRRAPACGLVRTPEERFAGYQFTISRNRK